MKQEVLFTHEECDEILNSVNEDNWIKSQIVSIDGNISYHKSSTRTCVEQQITEPTICDIILSKCKPIGMLKLPFFKIIKYTKGSFFVKHVDRGERHSYRLKSISIQLSNPEDYKGGDLIVKDVISSRERGNCIIFDSGVEHEVTLIKKGIRYSVIIWLNSETLRRDIKTII